VLLSEKRSYSAPLHYSDEKGDVAEQNDPITSQDSVALPPPLPDSTRVTTNLAEERMLNVKPVVHFHTHELEKDL
jgi:hypothetical protein